MTVATFKSIPDMKAKVKASGSNFFERETMEFFHSKLESPLIHGAYFVTSEYPDDPADKRYTARYFEETPTGFLDHRAIGGFRAYESVAEAKAAILTHLVNLREQKYLLGILSEVGLRYATYEHGEGEMALYRPDGECVLADIRDDGKGVVLIEGNRPIAIDVGEFVDPRNFVTYVRQQVDAMIERQG